MNIQTSRFGAMDVADQDVIHMSEGLLGFEDLKKYFIIDPSDDTMILWLQSIDRPEIAFPILEPKVFRPDYHVRLSANELRALKLDSVSKGGTLVYAILTIPEDPRNMTAINDLLKCLLRKKLHIKQKIYPFSKLKYLNFKKCPYLQIRPNLLPHK